MEYICDNSSIGKNVTFGHFVVVEKNVSIGENCIIGNNVVIHENVIIGNNVRIDDNTVIGKLPMKSVNSSLPSENKYENCIIEDNCLIGACTVIYIGSFLGEKCLVADLASIRENVKIGSRTIVGRGVAIENFTTIGMDCKIETNAYITAYSQIGNNVFIAPGVVTSNDNFASRSKDRFKYFKGVIIKDGGRIGAQATILPGKVINEDGFVAAGSVVTKEVEKQVIVTGNPAKFLRMVPDDQLLINQNKVDNGRS